jgi:hypothetical protein
MTTVGDLAGLLGVPEKRLAMLDTVDAVDLSKLSDAITAAMAKQDQAIADGVEKSLQAIPRPLRSRARAMLFPGGSA